MPEKVPGLEVPPPPSASLLEHAAFFDRHPEVMPTAEYMNNFQYRLPVWRDDPYWGVKDLNALRPAPDPLILPHLSERYLGGTFRDFFNDIDAAIREGVVDAQATDDATGVDSKEVDDKAVVDLQGIDDAIAEERAYHVTAEFGTPQWLEQMKHAEELKIAVNTLILPIYRRLREMGYRHHDLVK